MPKHVLITGATDGIGRETARVLASLGHHVMVHGRSRTKASDVAAALGERATSYVADFSRMVEVDRKQAIADGLVSVNGEVETRKRKKIRAGDQIDFIDHHIDIVSKSGD